MIPYDILIITVIFVLLAVDLRSSQASGERWKGRVCSSTRVIVFRTIPGNVHVHAIPEVIYRPHMPACICNAYTVLS